jgi:spore coat protein U-like protein
LNSHTNRFYDFISNWRTRTMKTLSASLKALVVASLACASGFAAAAETQNLTVTASVNAICKFTSAAQTLTFGALDPSNAVDTSGSGAAVTYKCTKGTTPTSVGVGAGLNGANNMKNTTTGNTDLIPYTLTAAAAGAGQGFGSGGDVAVTLTSRVTAADYADKSAGTYSDTVVLTLNY